MSHLGGGTGRDRRNPSEMIEAQPRSLGLDEIMEVGLPLQSAGGQVHSWVLARQFVRRVPVL